MREASHFSDVFRYRSKAVAAMPASIGQRKVGRFLMCVEAAWAPYLDASAPAGPSDEPFEAVIYVNNVGEDVGDVEIPVKIIPHLKVERITKIAEFE